MLKKFSYIALFCITILLITGCDTSSLEKIDDATYPYPDSKDVLVTLNEYNKIKTGMTESEVWNVIGGKCTSTGTTDLGMGDKYKTESYGCNGDGTIGANVILMFQGGKLTTMNQTGLK